MEACKGLAAELSKDFLWQVLQKRADYYHLQYTVPVLAFVRYLCPNPGTAVMWVHALKRLQLKSENMIDITALAFAFPVGFPKEEDLHKLWDEQKGIGGAVGNYLDTVAP